MQLFRRRTSLAAFLALSTVAGIGCTRSSPEAEFDDSDETTSVVVRLPVRLPDTLPVRRPDTPARHPVATPAEDEGPRMEVPAVPEPLVPPVDSALDGIAYLRSRRLMVPVAGVAPEALLGTFDEARGGGSRTHEALDILAPRGTPVLAADDGRVEKLHLSEGGGITLYQFDPTGRFVYYYAHLEAYREGMAEGETVRRGDVLGYVGTTGNAPPGTPHLHFAIGRLDAERRWWRFEPIDPLTLFAAPGRMAAGRGRPTA